MQGFELTDFSEVAFGVYSSHVEIIGNHIHDIGRICTDTQYGLDGVYMAASFVTVEGNLIHDIGRLGPGERGCQPATVYYENHDHGVYIEATGPRRFPQPREGSPSDEPVASSVASSTGGG